MGVTGAEGRAQAVRKGKKRGKKGRLKEVKDRVYLKGMKARLGAHGNQPDKVKVSRAAGGIIARATKM